MEKNWLSDFNLYERNCYECIKFTIPEILCDTGLGHVMEVIEFVRVKFHRYIKKDVYLKYLEVPITTRCNLRCKDCSNLIQYYENPYHIDAKQLFRDIYRVSQSVRQIKQLRILGGEALLHPKLFCILKKLGQIENIREIQLVTNGTVLPDERLIRLLKAGKYSVDLSNYQEKSIHRKEWIRLMKENNIRYITQKGRIEWTAQADFSYRNRNEEQLEKALSSCKMDCINMLNGRLNLCPRSSHGMDLGIVPDDNKNYVDFRNVSSKKAARKQLYNLLNIKYIMACNYCDIFLGNKLKKVRAAEQISKTEAMRIFNETLDLKKEEMLDYE